ncbi:MAG TPA: c-type cytochrome [Noviherbaspirillum sp.]|uniref:c-type cytochrome n=1 Tax=Noviherbaspirillum sp. TaxID=1926288 RepID=UPI002B481A63|nr:c-type cytochrome [Noviherbaspirillum sp.]HJV84075.1 c-type cytochrome [Noviherbaspirillum sp.]
MKMKIAACVRTLAIALPGLFVLHHSAYADAGEGTVEEGKNLYQATCAMCHGTELNASGGIPDLRKTMLDDDAFQQVVREGRSGTIMPPMKHALSDEEIRKIRTYVRSAAKG